MSFAPLKLKVLPGSVLERGAALAVALNRVFPSGVAQDEMFAALAFYLAAGVYEHIAGDRRAWLDAFKDDCAQLVQLMERGPTRSGAVLG